MTHLLMNIIGCFIAQQKSSTIEKIRCYPASIVKLIAIAICYLEEAPVDSAWRLDYWVL